MDFYLQKDTEYFRNTRTDLISLIPNNPKNRILEIGAGGGYTLIEIKKRNLAVELVGVELIKSDNAHQEDPLIDKFIICNVETEKIDLPTSYFDVILLGDVLEHLLDPWSFLHKISAHLKPNGLFIASVPNIRHYSAINNIIFKGDFQYQNQGLFDRTHYRFFCKKNIRAMFNTSAFTCEKIFPIERLFKGKSTAKFLNSITFGLFEQFLTIQYIVVSKKNG